MDPLGLVCLVLQLFIYALFARIILSWFPINPDSPFASVYSVLYTITEPVMGPVRNLIPSVGMMDLSPIVIFFGVAILRGIIGC